MWYLVSLYNLKLRRLLKSLFRGKRKDGEGGVGCEWHAIEAFLDELSESS